MNPERDRLLEDALKHELRAAAMAPATDACLDAETVAAWMDGGLDASGMAMAEAHASSCARCQSLLGSIARTVPAAVVAEPQGARLWRWWFAPLAATAAAVTVWMVVPQDRLTAPPAPPAMESAAPGATAAKADAEVAVTQSAPVPAPAALPSEAKEQAVVGRDRADAGGTRAEAAAPKREAQEFADAAAEGRAAAAAPPAAPAVALRKQIEPLADATARSSPSPTVVWLVGRAGVVHLATDGATFVRVPFPETVDLTAVTATDDRHATVIAADGRTFRTDDGGRTWQRP